MERQEYKLKVIDNQIFKKKLIFIALYMKHP